jgi:hypothetical protein
LRFPERSREHSWIKANELNRFDWPYGLARATEDEWAFGFLPPMLYAEVRDRILERARRGQVSIVERDDT